MSKRKIALMYEKFGKNKKYCCAECDHFRKINYHDKTYRKCEVYGLTRSEATDWKASNVACGLAPDKTYMGRNIVEMVTPHKDADEPITGQMTVQEYIDRIESLEEFARYMNKPEKRKESGDES